MSDLLISIWANTSSLEIVSVLFGLAYVILAARENIWCWPAAFISTATAIWLFWDASLVMESALNVYYLAMAAFGWWQWQYGGNLVAAKESKHLNIHSWHMKNHLFACLLIGILTLGSGYLLAQNTAAAWPYVDSFTTWSAVICTWMVARKVLENWLYWIVIDLAGVWLYSDRELYLYAGLYLVYSVIAVFGYLMWRKKFIIRTIVDGPVTRPHLIDDDHDR